MQGLFCLVRTKLFVFLILFSCLRRGYVEKLFIRTREMNDRAKADGNRDLRDGIIGGKQQSMRVFTAAFI